MFKRILTDVNHRKPWLYTCNVILATHSPHCPTRQSAGGSNLKRAEKSGPVRLGFIPEEWFTFFYPKTGVTGPYVFGIVVSNYLLSKEIYVMEHEYYLGLSLLLMAVVITKKFGKSIGQALDKQVDAIVAEVEKSRKDEIAELEQSIKDAKAALWMAEGQKVLMDAKKENIAFQLEAAYRERCMHVYKMVKGRMDYHVKKYAAEARVHQKWMIYWILREVNKSITPEFEKRALDQAIQDLFNAAAAAN